MIILGPKTAILGPQFCRILVLGPHFWWSGGPGPGAPLDPPLPLAPYNPFMPETHVLRQSPYKANKKTLTAKAVKNGLPIPPITFRFCQIRP